MELLVESFWQLTIFLMGVWQGPKYTSVYFT